MAWICDKNGNHRCEIKQLSYNGTFMEVSSITVTVESPAPIAFAIGDYIDWDYDGLRYTLDTAAGVEKQARRNSVGNAFLYENLVFLSPLQAAQNADFFDVILGNTNDFLTNTEFSFYGTAWDYAKRLEANLCRMYGSGTWKVRIWTSGTCYDATPATDLDTGAWENKLVDVSGIKCLAGFQQIYDLWGCAYVFSVVSGVNYVDFYDDFEQYAKAWQAGGMDKIFAYGKGNGLYKIRHTPDADHVLVTRLRPYGSGDNIPANYYLNSQDYHVDGNESSELAISHLMLPASQWTKDGVKHPSNAYLEQNTDLYGVREGVVLWDGSDEELGEIKPSIYGLTIQALLDLMASGDSYRPVAAKWPDTTQRIDKIITGAAPTDNGVKNEAGYDFTEIESSGSLAEHSFGTGGAYIDVEFNDLVMGTTPSVSRLAEFRIVPTSENKVAASFDVQASVASVIRAVNAYLTPYVGGVKISDATYPCTVTEEAISNTVEGITYTKRYKISLLDSTGNPIVFSSMYTGNVTFRIVAHIDFIGNPTGFPVVRNEYAVSFNLVRGNKAIDEYFSVTIPQIGFDLSAAVANGAKLCMRSGANQPREFQIIPSSVRYLPDTDTWFVRCKRSVDQSISTYFPNSNAVIAAGDEYYFTGIAMPPLYVEIAAQKLLSAATAWLAMHSKPRMLSAVDVDNKVMAVEGIVLKEGMSLPISDTDLDIQPGTQESRIIDNIRIEEGSDAIRTFSVTLRDKKEKSSLDAAIRGATSNLATNASVSEAVNAATGTGHGSLTGRDMPNQHPISAITGLEEALLSSGFFEYDPVSGVVKLKSDYDYLGPKKGLIFEAVGAGQTSGADLYVKEIATGGTTQRVLYSPLALITAGDQILGDGTPGGGGGGGAAYLWQLDDVDVPSVAGQLIDGQALVWDAASSKWTNRNITQGTVTRVDVGTTQYSPTDGVVSLPAYPTTLPASDVYAWAKALTKPSYALTEITGAADVQAIEALTGTSGLLRKTAANTWELDTNSYVTSSGVTSITAGTGLSGGTITGTGTIAISSTYQDYIAHGESAYNSLTTVSSLLQSLQAQIDAVASRDMYEELTASAFSASVAAISELRAGYAYAERYYLSDAVYFTAETVNGVICVKLNSPLITTGDQILGDGTPGGGGGGGDISYLYELTDVDDNLNAPASGTILQWYSNKWIGTAFTSIANGDLLTYASGKWTNVARTSVGIVTDATTSTHGLMSAADKTKLDGINTTYISNGQTAYENLSTVSAMLQSLQKQVDSVASRDMYEELCATAFYSDVAGIGSLIADNIELGGESLKSIPNSYLANHSISINGSTVNLGGSFSTASITAGTAGTSSATSGASISIPYVTMNAYGIVTAYGTHTHSVSLANLVGGSAVGSASLPVYYNGSALAACTGSSLFSAMSSGASTNFSVTVAGQTRTATLYATYDSASENISDKFSIVSGALQSLQKQIDSVASRSDISDFEATTEAKLDYVCDLMRSLQSQIDSVASRTADVSANGYFDVISVGRAIYGDVLITSGDQTLSDERRKTITREITLTAEQIASCRAVAFDWKDKPGSSFGSIAQDWQKILPESVNDVDDTLYHFYGQSAEVAVINLAREVVELKKIIRRLTS